MPGRTNIVLGLDVSSRSTGWAVLKNGRFYKRLDIDYGWIKIGTGLDLGERLHEFSTKLSGILGLVQPTRVGIEDVFFHRNPNTLKLLSRFSGVACELVYSFCDLEPIIVPVRSVRTILGTQDKKEVYNVITDKYKLYNWSYKTHNDITDALAITLYILKQQKKGS